MQHKSTEKTSFLSRGGFGLLSQFDRGVPFRKSTLEKRFGADLVAEAMQLHLVQIQENPNDKYDTYLYITQIGIKIRNN